MADSIRIKGGSGDVPTLQDRELAYSKSEKALYIGTGGGNVRLCGANDLTMILELNATINNLSNTIIDQNARIETMSKLIEDINTRLDALTPSE